MHILILFMEQILSSPSGIDPEPYDVYPFVHCYCKQGLYKSSETSQLGLLHNEVSSTNIYVIKIAYLNVVLVKVAF